MRRAFLVALLLLSGCQIAHYNKVQAGTFYGNARIEWISADEFIFLPQDGCDFYFQRYDGTIIRPKLMYTDGGSIPREFWTRRAYSPWGYGPAFVIHDWLFEAHKRADGSEANYSLDDAAMILSEATKTLMISARSGKTKVPIDKWAMYFQYLAVKSSIAKQLWDRPPDPIPQQLCDVTQQQIKKLLQTKPDAIPQSLHKPLREMLNLPATAAPPSSQPAEMPATMPSHRWE